MQEIFSELSLHLLEKVNSENFQGRYLIGIGGVPGSGKTTLADEVWKIINSKIPDIAVIVPMDGYHYYKKELDQMPNPEEAHERRGALWTFNAEAFLQKILEIKQNPEVTAPSFEHSIGDPVEDDIKIRKNHKIVLFPGIYVLVNSGIWEKISQQFDEKWYIDVNLDQAMEGLIKRHMKAWNWTEEKSRERVNSNDRINAEFIIESKKNADRIIPFLHDQCLTNRV